jgi:hypothetical protein
LLRCCCLDAIMLASGDNALDFLHPGGPNPGAGSSVFLIKIKLLIGSA